MIKVEQELVIGHAMYDSQTVQQSKEDTLLDVKEQQLQMLGASGRDLAIRATNPKNPPKPLSVIKSQDLKEYKFDEQMVKQKLKELREKLDLGHKLKDEEFQDRPINYSDHLMFIPFK